MSKGLLNKKQFEELEKAKERWLRSLSAKEAIRLEENFISSRLIWEWRKNFSKDKPLCLRSSLRKRT